MKVKRHTRQLSSGRERVKFQGLDEQLLRCNAQARNCHASSFPIGLEFYVSIVSSYQREKPLSPPPPPMAYIRGGFFVAFNYPITVRFITDTAERNLSAPLWLRCSIISPGLASMKRRTDI